MSILKRKNSLNTSWGTSETLTSNPPKSYGPSIWRLYLPKVRCRAGKPSAFHPLKVPGHQKQRDQVPHLFVPEFEDETAAVSMKLLDSNSEIQFWRRQPLWDKHKHQWIRRCEDPSFESNHPGGTARSFEKGKDGKLRQVLRFFSDHTPSQISLNREPYVGSQES